MNRSLTNVLFGGIAAPQQAKKIEGEVTQATVDDTVEVLANAENVVIVCQALQSMFTLTRIGGRIRHGSSQSAVRTG